MRIKFSVDQLPFCCGFYEVGSFQVENERLDDGWDRPFTTDLEEVIPQALAEAKGRPVIFNFVRERAEERDWDDDNDWWIERNIPLERRYECCELRQVVKKYPGVKHIHTWINPGTGNQIDSYVIKGLATK